MDLKDNDLPNGITSFKVDSDSVETYSLLLAFSSEQLDNEQLTNKAEELESNLKRLNGVKDTIISGEVEKNIKIDADYLKLNHLNLSMDELSKIISAQNTTIPIGDLKFEDDKITIDSSGKFENIDEIKNIIIDVSKNNDSTIKLKDIANVYMGYDEDSLQFFYNKKPTVLLALSFDNDTNIIKSSKEVMKEISKYQNSKSEDFNVDIITNIPDDIKGSVNNFVLNLIESIVIVLIVIMLGMSIKNAFIVSLAIPLSIFICFIYMKLFKVDIQFISLSALITSLGMLVDNAIVISDTIQLNLDKGYEKIDACVKGVKEVFLPVLVSMLTTVAIFSIFFFLPGTMGKFTISLPTIVIVTLVASYLVSISITPVLCFMFLKKSTKKEKTLKIKKVFDNLFEFCMKNKVKSILVSFIIVIFSFILLINLDTQLVPNSQKQIINIDIEADDINDIRKTKKIVEQIENILDNQEEMVYYLSSVGGVAPKYDFSFIPSHNSVNKASIILKIDMDKSSKFKNKAKFVENLQKLMDNNIPGARVVVKELGIIPSPSEPIQVRVLGNDLEKINLVALDIKEKLYNINGSKNVLADIKTKTYSYILNINNSLLNSLGLTKSQVQNELNIAMMGRDISKFRKDNKEYPIILKSDINSKSDFENFMIKSSITGSKHQLKQFSELSLKNDYTSISRYNGKRSSKISADYLSGFSPISIQKKLKKTIDKQDFDSNEIEFVYEGDNDLFSKVMASMKVGGVIAFILIFLIIYIQFNSFKQTIVIIMSIPFSIIGAALGLFIFNEKLSMFAIIGILSLMGVVVNNAIVLVEFINEETKNGKTVYLACKEAIEKRFRPILLSSATTILGLVPLAFSSDILFRGMAIAFMFGLLICTIFTIIIIPTIYSLFYEKK